MGLGLLRGRLGDAEEHVVLYEPVNTLERSHLREEGAFLQLARVERASTLDFPRCFVSNSIVDPSVTPARGVNSSSSHPSVYQLLGLKGKSAPAEPILIPASMDIDYLRTIAHGHHD